jgi:hypothetical protein
MKTRITGTSHEDQYKFLIISLSLLLRMWHASDKSCTETQNTHFIFNKVFFFFKSCRLCDNVQKYCTAGQASDDNIIRRMRIACRIPVYKHTDSEYVILLAFPQQQYLHERISVLHYTYFLSCYNWGGACFLRGTNWIFIYNSLQF